MATQKRQASVLGSTLTSLTLNSDLSSSEEETSEAEDEDVECRQRAKESGDSGDATDNEIGKISKQTQEKEVVRKSEKPSKPRVRMKTLTIDGQLVYFCVICDKVFTRRKDKLNHELAHSSETVLTCTECGKEYFHESSLAYHMRSHDGDQLHLCDLCPKMFAQGHHLKTHILSHSQPTEFSCKTCYQDFALGSDLSEHVRNKIKEEMAMHWCKMCKVYFCRNHSQVKHVNENKLHAHRCTACNELFYSHKKLRLHMKKFAHKSLNKPRALEPLAADEILYSQKGFFSNKGENSMTNISKSTVSNTTKEASGVKRHLDLDDKEDSKPFSKRRRLPSKCFVSEAIHSSSSLQDSAPDVKTFTDFTLKSPVKGRKGKPYCKKCNKSFKDISDLDSHKLLAHGESPKHFSCEICHQRFLSLSECDAHKAQHRKNEMHTCPICGQDFFHSAELTQHLKEHSGDFPYKCNQCGKSFRLKLQLIQHIRLHIPQPPLPCDKCSLQFSSRKDLDEHLLQVHHDEVDEFKCHLCSKVFPFHYKLQNHLRLHTNVRTFQCYICHKSFAMKHYLQRHLQVHLRQGMEVDMNNIIKTEAEEETVIGNVMCEETEIDSVVDVEDKLDPQNAVSSALNHQGLKDLKESEHRRYRSNSMLKLNFQRQQKDISSDSEESASSILTRESEKSDPFRFSSDGSDSFKFTMAKERRRLRKKRQLSRIALINKLNALKTEQFHNKQTESIKSSAVTEQDDAEAIQDLIVEINGVKSQTDNEMTIFVDLKEVKSSEFFKLPLHSVDMTDKENRLPCYKSVSQEGFDCLSEMRGKKGDFPEDIDALIAAKDDRQTLVLDIEMDEDSVDKFLIQEGVTISGKDSSEHGLPLGLMNAADVKVESLEKSCQPPLLKISPGSKSSSCPKSGHENLPPGKTSTLPSPVRNLIPSPAIIVGSSSVQGVEKGGLSSSATTYLAVGEDVKLSQPGVNTMQPLQSLHFMTSQIQDQSKDCLSQRISSSTALQTKVKDEKKKSKPSPIPPAIKQPSEVNLNSQNMSSSASGSSNVFSSHGIVNVKSNQSHLQPSETIKKQGPVGKAVIANVSRELSSKTTVKQGKALNINTSSTQIGVFKPFTSPTSAIVTLSQNSPHHSGTLHTNLPCSDAMGISMASSSAVLKPTLSFHFSEHKGQVPPFASTSYLSTQEKLGLSTTQAEGSICHSLPPKFVSPEKSPFKSHSSSIAASSHFSTVSGFCSPSKRPSSSSSLPSPLCPKPILISNNSKTPRPSLVGNLSSSSQMFDTGTKDPTLRNINMMELVEQNQGSASFAPTTVLAGPSFTVNTIQNNQNINSAGTFIGPPNPGSVLPSSLGPLSTGLFPHNSTSIPAMSSNVPGNILINDIPGHNIGNAMDLPMLNSFGGLPPSMGTLGPSIPTANLDFGLANANSNMSGFGPIANICNMNSINQGMVGGTPSLSMPVGNIGGLDAMPTIGNINPNPMPLLNMEVMANTPSAALRPTNTFNSINLLPFGASGGMGGFNSLPSGVPSFNGDLNFHGPAVAGGSFLPMGGIGSSVMPVGASNIIPNPPFHFPIASNQTSLPIGAVNLPLGMSLMPDSGIFPSHPML